MHKVYTRYPGPPQRWTGRSRSKSSLKHWWRQKWQKPKLSYFMHIMRKQFLWKRQRCWGKTTGSRKRARPNMKWTDCKISHRSASRRTEQGCLSQDIVDSTHSEGHQGLEPTQGHTAHRERPVPICLHSVCLLLLHDSRVDQLQQRPFNPGIPKILTTWSFTGKFCQCFRGSLTSNVSFVTVFQWIWG